MSEQKEELIDFSHYNRIYIYSEFWNISKEHQRLHEKYLELASQIFEHDQEWQREDYYDFRKKSQQSGYIAIVFAAMYIEGAIYNFGAIYLGDNYVKKNLDKLGVLAKISVILRMVTGKDIDPDSQAFEHLKILLKYRNSLVHSKSRPIVSPENFFEIQEKGSKEYYQAIESAKKAIEYLDAETKQLHIDENFPGIFGHDLTLND